MDQNEILKYVEPILQFCKKRLNNSHDAEDLAGDIILNVLSGMKKYEIKSLDAWVWRIAHNRYAHFIDADSKNIMILSGDESVFDIADPSDYEAEIDENEEFQMVFRYLHTLSSLYKNIFVDYYLGEKSVRELSVKYSLPETTVKWRLNEGRRKIKDRIGENEMDKVYKHINWNTKTCNGNAEPDRYLHSQIARAICLAAYEKPVTVEEISVATGIPTMYIEDELPELEYGDAVIKTGNKCATDFIILSLENNGQLEKISTDLVKKLADSFEKSFSEKADLVKKLDFYGNCFGMERLGYIAVPFVLRNLVSKTKTKLHFENGAYPVRKDGGHGWFIVAETEDECEIADDYSAGCNVAGDDSGSASAMGSHIYYYWVNKYFKSSIYHGFGIRWMCAESIPQNSENGFIKTELNDESAAQLIRNNLIIKSGNGYMLNFACFSREAFDEFISLFEIENKKISTALSEWIKELRKGFAAFVPKRLNSQINQWVSCYANRLAGYVTEELIGRGVLETPQNEVPFTDGVFYVEGEYINNI
ncbi:MAG: sigma-70 family RNA polymerase sigma factor [Clostridia bacterium]|nr:sigma-70 family RNA polymerase sigma factor [Clostridia bacterium]